MLEGPPLLSVINACECTFPYVLAKVCGVCVCVRVCVVCVCSLCASFMIQRGSVRLGSLNQVAGQLNV